MFDLIISKPKTTICYYCSS